jgi:hypothetical protein
MKKHQIILTIVLVILSVSFIVTLSDEGYLDILSDTVSDNGGSYTVSDNNNSYTVSDNGDSYEQSLYSSMSVDIKQSIQEEFNENDRFSSYEIKVRKVSLIEVGLNSYKAYVDITYLDGQEYLISADVYVSDEQYFWEFPAGTFLFLWDGF